jgi:tetratricopeptide (TPR) repeat protein
MEVTRLDEARRSYEMAISILQQGTPRNLNQLLILRLRLAELHLESNQNATAEKLVKHILAQIPPDTAFSMTKAYGLDVLACTLAFRKEFAAAETAERESLAILSTVNGVNASSLAIGTLHLSVFLNRLNRPAEALVHATRALELLSGSLLPQLALQAEAEITIASIYARSGRRADAEQQAELLSVWRSSSMDQITQGLGGCCSPTLL